MRKMLINVLLPSLNSINFPHIFPATYVGKQKWKKHTTAHKTSHLHRLCTIRHSRCMPRGKRAKSIFRKIPNRHTSVDAQSEIPIDSLRTNPRIFTSFSAFTVRPSWVSTKFGVVLHLAINFLCIYRYYNPLNSLYPSRDFKVCYPYLNNLVCRGKTCDVVCDKVLL